MRAELEAELRTALSRDFEGQLADARAKVGESAALEARVLKQQRELAEREQRLDLDVERRVGQESKRIREQEATAAREQFSREADERVRVKQQELAVEMERRVGEATALAREQEGKLAEQRAELQTEQQRLRDEEHRQKIAGLEKTIGELQRKVQQGSQQTQGEAQEVVLRELLASAFPADAIDDVAKGVHGADVVQGVRDGSGRVCGSIVWESKRTRSWSDGWLAKLRDDQRAAGGACAVIVTQTLPPDVRSFGQKEGVWICAPSCAVALGHVLRLGLLEVAAAKRAAEGSGLKMQVLYDYLTGTEFRNRVEGMLEAFADMQEDLATEKRAMLTRWKRREKTIERALGNVTAFYGDLQGIAGRQLKDLPPLSLESTPGLPELSADDNEEAPALRVVRG